MINKFVVGSAYISIQYSRNSIQSPNISACCIRKILQSEIADVIQYIYLEINDTSPKSVLYYSLVFGAIAQLLLH